MYSRISAKTCVDPKTGARVSADQPDIAAMPSDSIGFYTNAALGGCSGGNQRCVVQRHYEIAQKFV